MPTRKSLPRNDRRAGRPRNRRGNMKDIGRRSHGLWPRPRNRTSSRPMKVLPLLRSDAVVLVCRIADVCKPALQRFLRPAATRYDHLQTEAFAVKRLLSGFMSLNGSPEGPPTKAATILGNNLGGCTARTVRRARSAIATRP